MPSYFTSDAANHNIKIHIIQHHLIIHTRPHFINSIFTSYT